MRRSGLKGSLLSEAAASTAAAARPPCSLRPNGTRLSRLCEKNPANCKVDREEPRPIPAFVLPPWKLAKDLPTLGSEKAVGIRVWRLPSVPPPDADNLLKIGLDRDHFRRLGISEMQE